VVGGSQEQTIILRNPCLYIGFDVEKNRIPENKFFGFIEADDPVKHEKECFTPRLRSNTRSNAREGRITSIDVLQVLKTRLSLCFPTDAPVTLYDTAIKDGILLSAFHILRGGPSIYEKYGYASTIYGYVKDILPKLQWSSLDHAHKSYILDITGLNGVHAFNDTLRLMKIMKTISYEDEAGYYADTGVSLSKSIYEWIGMKQGFSEEMSDGTLEIKDDAKLMTHDKHDPGWLSWKNKMVFTHFTEVQQGGRRHRA